MNEPEIEKIINANSLAGTIESFSGRSATIILDDGQKINWPITELPTGCQAGQKIRLKLIDEAAAENEKEKLAKSILNEILK